VSDFQLGHNILEGALPIIMMRNCSINGYPYPTPPGTLNIPDFVG